MSTFELTLASREIRLVWPYELEAVTSFQVIRQVNDHAHIRFTGIIPDAHLEKYIETVSSQDSIQVFQKNGSRDIPIFSGMVSNMSIHAVRDTYVAEVEGISHTFDLDVKRRSQSYQNRSTTYDQVIRQVIAPYPGSDYIDMAHSSQTVGKFLMQYEETDWQFIRRLASHTGAVLVPDVTLLRPAFWFGMPELDPPIELSATSYGASKNHRKHITYEVESKQLLSLGQLVRFKGQEMVVAGSVIELDRGIIRMRYTLAPPQSIRQPKQYNPLLTGLSLDGRVIKVHRKMIQLHLDIDQEEPPESNSWFPYSGEGNNAWYTMPKVGGRVQLYFPDSNENHAFTTSATRGAGEKMQSHPKMGNPNVKSFVNDSGKTMELAERNISFTTGPVSIIMDEQGVKLDSPAKIVVKTSEELSLGLPLPGGDTESTPTPLITVKAEKSLSFMQGGFTGLEIEDLHKMLSNKTYIEGTSTETVAYPPIVSEGQAEAQQATQKLEQYKLSEERKSKGALNILGGLMNTIVGAVTVAAGVAAVGVGVAFGWTGVGLVLAGAGAVAIAAGAYTAASGVADIAEGVQDYNYGSKGDTQTPAFNFVRDTLFDGNEEAYRMSVDIAMITGGLAAEFVAPFLVLSSVLGTSKMMNRTNSSQKPASSSKPTPTQKGGPGVNRPIDEFDDTQIYNGANVNRSKEPPKTTGTSNSVAGRGRNAVQIEYRSDNLSEMVAQQRLKDNAKDARNYAVFEYEKPDGSIGYKTAHSEGRGGRHSEKVIHDYLKENEIDPSKVKRIYSERQFCDLEGHDCSDLIARNYPHAETSYSFPFDTKEAAIASKKKLMEEMKELFK
ncbi:nucleic acid/nucleotide deaminase domain-containing protein [Paenibacillus terrae]|uniref:Gp5/Type VI secretion system Vgr protein OB-fold domain-containing protein n=1 Tax=Paenibacillus terrae TaxID=159743 RepID=A0A0D7WU90_9BACL|nr:nucleic acid/nucleotide deaminase domain-containing protein [Paenibacillus terrae]KJD42584.1 hypothetical protein QD47_27350 [Paenibacillus terrae]